MILYYVLTAVYAIACALLLLVVLLQQGKGDIAAAFGGGGSQSAFGARAGATVLTKATAVLGVVFMVGALVLAIMGQRGPGSLLRGAPVPAPLQGAPVTTTPPPAGTPAPAETPAPAPSDTTTPAPAESPAPTPAQ
jgi:preprotein translocase subunit SecG